MSLKNKKKLMIVDYIYKKIQKYNKKAIDNSGKICYKVNISYKKS